MVYRCLGGIGTYTNTHERICLRSEMKREEGRNVHYEESSRYKRGNIE